MIDWTATTAPNLCVSDAELQAQCRVDDVAELASLRIMAAAVQDHIETVTGQLLTLRDLAATFRYAPPIRWTVYPVVNVAAISWTPAGGLTVTPPASAYRVGVDGLEWADGAVSPDRGDLVTMTIEAGHVEPPPALKFTLLAAVSHSFDHRDAQTSKSLDEFLARAVARHRRIWLT